MIYHIDQQIEFLQLVKQHGLENVEWRRCSKGGHWYSWCYATKSLPAWMEECTYEYRVKRKMGRFPAVDLPLPETEAPPVGTRYFLRDCWLAVGWSKHVWTNHPIDVRLLELGQVYLREEDITLVAKHARVMPVEGDQ